jgi:hypothetical protein
MFQPDFFKISGLFWHLDLDLDLDLDPDPDPVPKTQSKVIPDPGQQQKILKISSPTKLIFDEPTSLNYVISPFRSQSLRDGGGGGGHPIWVCLTCSFFRDT